MEHSRQTGSPRSNGVVTVDPDAARTLVAAVWPPLPLARRGIVPGTFGLVRGPCDGPAVAAEPKAALPIVGQLAATDRAALT